MGEKEAMTGEALRESPTKASLGQSAVPSAGMAASADSDGDGVPDGNEQARRQHGDVTIAKYSDR